jgi:hypothetical protein
MGGHHRLSGVQRVMVAAPAGDEAEVAWLRRTMSGRGLIDEQGQWPPCCRCYQTMIGQCSDTRARDVCG